MPRRDEAIGGPNGSGNPEMLIGAVERPFPVELFEAVLLLWHNLYLAEVVVTGGPPLILQLPVLPAALLAGSYEE